MWLPEWVNIEEGARQSTPLEGDETAGGRTPKQEVYSVCFQQRNRYLPTHRQQTIKVTNTKDLDLGGGGGGGTKGSLNF
jgi:hypothetical protein